MTNEIVTNQLAGDENLYLRRQIMSLRDAFREHQNKVRSHYELSETEMEVILYIDKHGPQKMKNVGQAFDIKFSTLTSLVDKIENLGLIKRMSSRDDRRSVILTLTKKGKKFVDEYDQQVVKYAEVIAQQPSDKDLFTRVLDMIAELTGMNNKPQAEA